MAAAHVIGIKDDNIIINMMIELEGHPDNVVPAYLGGFVSSYKTDSGYKWTSYSVSEKFKFLVLYPDFKLSTKSAREALPKKIDYESSIFNLSRIIHLPKALMEGDLILLNDVLDDKLHEPYRLPLIPDGKEIYKCIKTLGYAGCISGAGSAFLVIGYDYSFIDYFNNLDKNCQWTIVKTNIKSRKVEVL